MNLIDTWNKRTGKEKVLFKKFLSKAAKSRNKDLNEIANYVHDDVFDHLDCLDCANCCKSIPPILNEMDVKRASKILGIRPLEFKDKYTIIDEDQDMVMNSSPCPFLEADNKCFIYEGRPRACREYPHTDNYEFQKNIKLHLKNTDYCPAVYHILIELNDKLNHK